MVSYKALQDIKQNNLYVLLRMGLKNFFVVYWVSYFSVSYFVKEKVY